MACILERIDFLNTSAIALENITSHQFFTAGSHLIKQIIQVSICPGVIEIQKRANLCLPLLLFLTQTRHKYCQPIQAVINKINRLKSLRDKMIELDCAGAINSFLGATEGAQTAGGQ